MSKAYQKLHALLFGETPYSRNSAPEAMLLGELAPVLPAHHLRQALFICSSAAFVPLEARAAVMARALESSGDVDARRDAFDLLIRIPALVRWLPLPLLEQLLSGRLIEGSSAASPSDRADVVAEIAGRGVKGSQDLLRRELERVVDQLGVERRAAGACQVLLRRRRGGLRAEQATSIEQAAERLQDSADRVAVLVAVLPWLRGSSRLRVEEVVAREALAVRHIPSRLRALLALADVCAEPRRSALVEQVLEGGKDLEGDFKAQVSLVAALVPRTPQPKRRALIQAVRDEYSSRQFLWPGADLMLAQAFAGAAKTLPRQYLPALADAVRSLDVGSAVLDDPALHRLVPFLSARQRKAALTVVVQSWRDRNFSRAGSPAALGVLAPHLSRVQASSIVQDISQVAMSDEYTGAGLIVALARKLRAEPAADMARIAASMSSEWFGGRALLALREFLPAATWQEYESRANAVSPERLRTLLGDLKQKESDDILGEFLTSTWERYAGAAPPGASTKVPVKKVKQGAAPSRRAAKKAAPAKKTSRQKPGTNGLRHNALGVDALVSDDQPPTAKREPAPSSVGSQALPDAEAVDAAVFCPPEVARTSRFMVQVYLYPPARSGEATTLAKEADAGAERRGVLSLLLDLPRGTRVDLHLEMPTLKVEEADAQLIWRGATTGAQFEVEVPAGAPDGTAIGRMRFSIAGVPAGTLRFQVSVVSAVTTATSRQAEIWVKRYRRAFVSYSSKDRAEVLRRVQAFKIAGMTVFQDILDLDPGERWEKGLYRKIDGCDVFLLFWSQAAADSPWVGKEIDYAIARQKGDPEHPPVIQPVPIEGPPIPDPPTSLRHLHFNDALLAHIAAA